MTSGLRAQLLFSFVLLLVGGVVVANAQTDVETRNKAAVQDRFAAWAAGTGSPLELLADEATWTVVGRSMASKTYRDRAEFMSEVIGPFNARMKEALKPSIRQIFADDDWVIVFFDASGVTRNETPYTNTYAWFLQMREGKIVNAYALFDSIAFDELWQRVQPGL